MSFDSKESKRIPIFQIEMSSLPKPPDGESQYYGQYQQDKHLIENIYHFKRDGFFVDVGAFEPKRMSNTYILERDYNWKGICLEPNRETFKNLVKERKCRCYQIAVYNQDNILREFVFAGVLSGLKADIDKHKMVLNNYSEMIPCKKLETILDENQAPRFCEYLSLDTEGSEYEILSVFNFDKYQFGYICVEHNFVEEKRRKIRGLLEQHGYLFYRQNQVDDEYIHPFVKKELDAINIEKSLNFIDLMFQH